MKPLLPKIGDRIVATWPNTCDLPRTFVVTDVGRAPCSNARRVTADAVNPFAHETEPYHFVSQDGKIWEDMAAIGELVHLRPARAVTPQK